jgi:hypothetical protein
MEEQELERRIAERHPGWTVAVAKFGRVYWIDLFAGGRRFTIEMIPGETGIGVSELLPDGPEIDFSGHDAECADLDGALAYVERALESKDR